MRIHRDDQGACFYPSALAVFIDRAASMTVPRRAAASFNGRMHTVLNEGGLCDAVELSEKDVEDYTRYLHSVIGNRIVELTIDDAEPIECEVVIPCNIIPRAPEEAVAEAIERFRRSTGPSPEVI